MINAQHTIRHNKSRSSWFSRLTVYITSFALLYQPLMPAVGAVLTDSDIQDSLNSVSSFEVSPSERYQFQSPSYLNSTAPNAVDLDGFYRLLFDHYSHTIQHQPAKVMMRVGSISVAVPGYKRVTPALVGTPAVQSRYIRQQIQELLGRHLIDTANPSYATEAAQLNTLYTHAFNYINSHPEVRYGDALNLDQTNTGLVHDMVWPEFRQVNGQQVVVPVVYLSNHTIANRAVNGNVTELLGNVSLDALTIEGVSIQLGRDAFLRVAGDLLNDQGQLSGEGDLSITAGDHLVNLSGLIESTGTLQVAAHSITNQTIVYRYHAHLNKGEEQGTRYGDIAAINAVNGDVVLRSYSDIQFHGAQAEAGRNLTLAADGDIYLGSQTLQTNYSAYGYQGPYSNTSSTISYLQSSLTAQDTLQLMASGEIVIDAANISSDQGHIEILASLGIKIESDLSHSRLAYNFKGGQHTAYKSTILPALLKSGLSVTLQTDFGDITLRSANITSQEGTVVKATSGALHLLGTVERDEFHQIYSKSSGFTTKSIDRGHNVETLVPNTIIGGFSAEAAQQITVEFTGDSSLTLDQQIDKLSATAGLEWMANVRAQTPAVDWVALDLHYDTWYRSNRSIAPETAALLAIFVAVATGGAASDFATWIQGGASQATATTTAALKAGAQALFSQAALVSANNIVNGEFDPLKTFDDLATIETAKTVGFAIVSTAAITELDSILFTPPADDIALSSDSILFEAVEVKGKGLVNALSLEGQAAQALTHAAVKAGLQHVVYDAPLDESFFQLLSQHAINTLGQQLATKIGILAHGDPVNGIAPDIDAAMQYIAHAAAGCLTGSLRAELTEDDLSVNTGCVTGAGGAVIGEFVGQQYRGQTKEEQQAYLKEWLDEKFKHSLPATESEFMLAALEFKQRGIDLSRLSAALLVFAVGGNATAIDLAAESAANAAKYNLFSFFLESELIQSLKRYYLHKVIIYLKPNLRLNLHYSNNKNLESLRALAQGGDTLSLAINYGTSKDVELLASVDKEKMDNVINEVSILGGSFVEGYEITFEGGFSQTLSSYLWDTTSNEKKNRGNIESLKISSKAVSKLKAVTSLLADPRPINVDYFVDVIKGIGYEELDLFGENKLLNINQLQELSNQIRDDNYKLPGWFNDPLNEQLLSDIGINITVVDAHFGDLTFIGGSNDKLVYADSNQEKLYLFGAGLSNLSIHDAETAQSSIIAYIEDLKNDLRIFSDMEKDGLNIIPTAKSLAIVDEFDNTEVSTDGKFFAIVKDDIASFSTQDIESNAEGLDLSNASAQTLIDIKEQGQKLLEAGKAMRGMRAVVSKVDGRLHFDIPESYVNADSSPELLNTNLQQLEYWDSVIRRSLEERGIKNLPER